jgi:hypothetical protein
MADSILHPRASLGLTVAPLEAPKSLLLIKPVESDYDRCLADFDEPDPEPEEVETAVMRLFQQRLHSSASDDATEIIPGLYLGNAVAARHTEWLAATAPSWYLINCAGSMEVRLILKTYNLRDVRKGVAFRRYSNNFCFSCRLPAHLRPFFKLPTCKRTWSSIWYDTVSIIKSLPPRHAYRCSLQIDSEDYDARLAVEHGVAWITAGVPSQCALSWLAF